jgi:hypothetical protein
MINKEIKTKKSSQYTILIAVILILLSISVISSIFVLLYFNQDKNAKNTEQNIVNSNNNEGNYTGSYFQGNYIWAGAMNLAWNELVQNILHDEVKLNTNKQDSLKIARKLNKSVFSKNDLDTESYYVKSGYGQKTVDLINLESRQKFPNKSFADLDLRLTNNDIISYAYLLKKVKYKTTFTEKKIKFINEDVQGFYAKNSEEKENIKIVKYWDDTKFIIKIQLQDNQDEIFLAKGFTNSSPKEVVNNINEDNLQSLDKDDIFAMPKLHLNYQREYTEIIGIPLANKGFENYFIQKMFENIKFDMDQMGARVENEAVIVPIFGSAYEPKKVKEFILDQPFWVIMKRSNSQNPYFILGINNNYLTLK